MANKVLGVCGDWCKNSAMLHAIEIPSYVDVPLPISSSKIKLLAVRLFMMLAVSFISTINVLSPPVILSDAPTLVKILSVNGIFAEETGTKLPMCAIKVISAVCLKIALLPLMFGPVRMMSCLVVLSRKISLLI